ncbi:hypothetical protein N9954_06655 [Maribacter sp.]|nr:hypothetical protein [Maribacter sp.]
MKKNLLVFCTVIFCSTLIQAQSNCSKYYPLEEGRTFQYTIFNKKGKADGVTDYSITNVNNSSGSTSATFNLKYIDKKGKEMLASEYDVTCTGDGIKIDYMSIMPSQMMSQYEEMGMEMDISGTDIELPNNLISGQELTDANVTINMNMGGIKMNVSVAMTDRKVISKEAITTAAGSFDCFVITETIKSKAMGANIEMNTKLWLAEGVGMVKQETYKKNGSLDGSTELTKFNM